MDTGDRAPEKRCFFADPFNAFMLAKFIDTPNIHLYNANLVILSDSFMGCMKRIWPAKGCSLPEGGNMNKQELIECMVGKTGMAKKTAVLRWTVCCPQSQKF